MILEQKKSNLKTIGLGALLILVGAAIGAATILALVGRNQQKEEQVRREYIVEYTKSEEVRLGVDCKILKGKLRDFLQSEIGPVLRARRPGQGWSSLISDDLRARTGKQRDHLFACGSLYLAGRRGEWNGLKDLDFSVALDKEMIVVDTLVRFGDPKTKCDASCLDQNFKDLEDAVKKLESHVQ